MATLESSRAATGSALFAGLSLRTWNLICIAAVVIAACVVPFVVSSYQLLLVNQVVVYAVALLGLNILTGYNGQFSLGHGAFYAIGAYTTAILLDKTGIPYWATIPIAGLICFVVGFLFGLPALRLEGHYLALVTLALAISTPQLLKFKDFDFLTGGVQGIVITAPDTPWGLPLRDDQWFYFFCLMWTGPLFVVGWNLLRGRTGRALVAIRDHPLAAASMGIDLAFYKTAAFGVSAMYTGIAGALGAILAQFVAPDSFDVFLSIRFLVGSVFGGVASMVGTFFGGMFVEFVPNLAEQISKAAPQAVYGIVLIICMYLMPTGAAGLLRVLGHRLRRAMTR
jgi:branched-chain amino acid transport system permease protein